MELNGAAYCITTIGARQKANVRAVGLSTLTWQV
jgi:sorbitol-specific phosphotransferase system component IIA